MDAARQVAWPKEQGSTLQNVLMLAHPLVVPLKYKIQNTGPFGIRRWTPNK
jgi:hypothetical protein